VALTGPAGLKRWRKIPEQEFAYAADGVISDLGEHAGSMGPWVTRPRLPPRHSSSLPAPAASLLHPLSLEFSESSHHAQ
jgi:hypothetical protein